MSNTDIRNDGTIPELVLKLCKSLASNDDALLTRLNERAFRVISQSINVAAPSPSDEPFYLSHLRNTVKTKSPEHLEKFDLLYTNLSKSGVIKDKGALLCFLYNVSKGSATPLTHKLENLHTKQGSVPQCFVSADSASVRHIFERGLPQGSTVASTVVRANSQATTISSAAWSHHEIPSSKATICHAVTEQELLQEVIYSLFGIQSKYLRREPGGHGYSVDPKCSKGLSIVQRSLMERLIGLSFLHNQLKYFCEENEKQSGIICLAFVAILKSELSDYYKTVALLQANSEMTLRRALFVLQDHRIEFEWLAYIAETCSEQKGGALITAVHGFLQHGSKTVRVLSEKVLKAVCKPLYNMLSRWLLDGEINDPCNEFFIEAKSGVPAEKLWHNKYNVRKSMVPSFINIEQAKRILATGKSINFLRHICQDGGQLPGREVLLKLFDTASAEALFAPEQSIEFHSTLEIVYKETSLRVLDLLKNKFNLYGHLQSLRRYLLLGQGDFIRHLLELLAPELNKDAEGIYGHTLSAILDSAIQVTNAQFEDEDTLNRLNVSFMNPSIGDKGWDVFSLIYVVDGPIGTIFQPTMSTYQSLFGALWKAKRTEFVLANMRRQQLSAAKLFRKIKELKPVMHIIHILTSKMIHFIHQTQYYFLFEVLECSWAEMQNQVNKADCLDDIITAHTNFLNSVQRGVLQDDESRQLFSHLISIYNFVLNIERHQEAVYEAASKEFEAYVTYKRKAESKACFELGKEEEEAAKLRTRRFHQFLHATKLKLKTAVETYDVIVIKFLELLASNSNMNLQLLSVRLSFNNFYKLA